MPRTVQVKVDVPSGTSKEDKQAIEKRAREGAVLALWQAADLSNREAAEALGLTYHEFLDLLSERGIPVCQSGVHPDVVRDLVKSAQQRSK